jgi:hypothetical protein
MPCAPRTTGKSERHAVRRDLGLFARSPSRRGPSCLPGRDLDDPSCIPEGLGRPYFALVFFVALRLFICVFHDWRSVVDHSSDVPIEYQEHRDHAPNEDISTSSWDNHYCTLLVKPFLWALNLKAIQMIEHFVRMGRTILDIGFHVSI